ncbi:MAG TPA: rhomboid family intramembrane serine protease [Gammaproteobacteria bacterium]|nr:rhomboid family intramembrane serine protease [Gammaproteobacteria bacterium]
MQPAFRKALVPVIVFISLLWLVVILGLVLHLPLIRLGIYPRTAAGLAGVLFAPLIHGSWSHLLSNSFALLVLGTALRYAYPRAAGPALVLIYLLSGLGVWCLGRDSYHIGASGLTHGMMFFIFTTGILRRDRLPIALSMIVFFLYGGMVWSIFPQEPDISYESHFFGAASGVLAAFLFRRLDPLQPEKHYDWEDAAEDDTDNDTDAEETPPER